MADVVVARMSPGSLGITTGMPVIVDPSANNKGVSVDKVVSLSKQVLGIAGTVGSDGLYPITLEGPATSLKVLTPGDDYWAGQRGLLPRRHRRRLHPLPRPRRRRDRATAQRHDGYYEVTGPLD